MKKYNIPHKVKVKVWKRCSLYQRHPHVTRCATCPRLVYMPQSLRKHFGVELSKCATAQGVFGVGEFGHIVSEFNGGTAREHNLTS